MVEPIGMSYSGAPAPTIESISMAMCSFDGGRPSIVSSNISSDAAGAGADMTTTNSVDTTNSVSTMTRRDVRKLPQTNTPTIS